MASDPSCSAVPRNFYGLLKSHMLDMSLTLFSLLFLKIENALGTAPALADWRHFPADLMGADVSTFQGNPVKKSSSAWENLAISRSLPKHVAYLGFLSRDPMCPFQTSRAAFAPTARKRRGSAVQPSPPASPTRRKAMGPPSVRISCTKSGK